MIIQFCISTLATFIYFSNNYFFLIACNVDLSHPYVFNMPHNNLADSLISFSDNFDSVDNSLIQFKLLILLIFILK